MEQTVKTGVSIVLATPVGGKREHSFGNGSQLAKFLWDNCPIIFRNNAKGEAGD